MLSLTVDSYIRLFIPEEKINIVFERALHSIKCIPMHVTYTISHVYNLHMCIDLHA